MAAGPEGPILISTRHPPEPTGRYSSAPAIPNPDGPIRIINRQALSPTGPSSWAGALTPLPDGPILIGTGHGGCPTARDLISSGNTLDPTGRSVSASAMPFTLVGGAQVRAP